jgi:hypothetical protein
MMTTAGGSAPSAGRSTATAFPPVQPVGVAAKAGPDTPPKWNASAPDRDAVAKPVRQARGKEKAVRQAASRERAKPRRHARPAPFPIRQFLAALRR